jgi:hypothetical protein
MMVHNVNWIGMHVSITIRNHTLIHNIMDHTLCTTLWVIGIIMYTITVKGIYN